MHKCINCGKEYEGNFCPFCGAHMGEEKLCPKCGTHCSPNAKFCNNCGYAFDGAEKSVSKNTGSISEFTIKAHIFAEYLPCALFLIFSVLLFGLFAAPVAIMPGGEVLGEKIPSQSYGNLYDLCGGEYNELFPNLQIYGRLGILFAALSAVLAVCVTIFSCARPFKFKRLNLFGIRGAIRLTDVAEGIACIFYIAFIIITSVTTAKISGLDGGIGLIKAGACPVSVLVLSCVFLVLHLIARLTEYYLDKHVPEISVSARGEKYYRGEYALDSISALKLKNIALIFILCCIFICFAIVHYFCR